MGFMLPPPSVPVPTSYYFTGTIIKGQTLAPSKPPVGQTEVKNMLVEFHLSLNRRSDIGSGEMTQAVGLPHKLDHHIWILRTCIKAGCRAG